MFDHVSVNELLKTWIHVLKLFGMAMIVRLYNMPGRKYRMGCTRYIP